MFNNSMFFSNNVVSTSGPPPPPDTIPFIFDVLISEPIQSFSLPLIDSGSYNMTVKWGDSTQNTINT